jgi:hypothetical protein
MTVYENRPPSPPPITYECEAITGALLSAPAVLDHNRCYAQIADESTYSACAASCDAASAGATVACLDTPGWSAAESQAWWLNASRVPDATTACPGSWAAPVCVCVYDAIFFPPSPPPPAPPPASPPPPPYSGYRWAWQEPGLGVAIGLSITTFIFMFVAAGLGIWLNKKCPASQVVHHEDPAAEKLSSTASP